MMTVESRTATAVSLDRQLVHSLPSRLAGARIHSVHRRVVNILDAAGGLLTLSSDELDDAPDTIRIPADQWSLVHVDQDAPVAPSACGLSLEAGDLLVDVSGARRWSPGTVDFSHVTAAGFIALAEAVDSRLADIDAHAEKSAFELAASGLLEARSRELLAALVAADAGAFTSAAVHECMGDPAHRRIAEAVRSLIGLGAGLTPSGDDLLTGLSLVAAQDGLAISGAGRIVTRVLDANPDATGLLSLVTMRHAAGGRGRQRLHDLLTASAEVAARDRTPDSGDTSAGENDRLGAALTRVLEIGHSSGADILRGIRLAFRAEAQLRGTERPGG